MSNFVVQSNVHLNDIKGKITTLATDIGAAHILVTKDTFTHHTNPTITVADGSPVNKEFHVVGGVDNSDGTFSNINPIKVSDSGYISVAAGLEAYSDVADPTTNVKLKASSNRLEVAVVGSNDTDGGAPHRHLTIDADGRTLTQPLMTTTNTKLDAIATAVTTQITRGQDVKDVDEGLQQVLIYGRKNDGTLQPLECVGDRLIVDVIELNPTGPHTPTSLPSVAVHAQVEGTNGFKNLQVNAGGILKISNQNNEYVEVQGVSHPIGANAASSIEINAEGYGKLRITIHSSSTDELLIEGSSTSGGTFMVFSSLFPSNIAIDNSGNTANMATIVIDCPPSYLRLRNAGAAEITLEKYIFTSMVN